MIVGMIMMMLAQMKDIVVDMFVSLVRLKAEKEILWCIILQNRDANILP